ncbi:N-acetylmuramoyl-L-alanine amidase [Sporosarcina sp. HYO08]|uniref:N-acetylmuramoyl-L-alanine amidase n=1 Tax=Sporosarcina sp. HYO08 TaxID=1759557 RepID=UPI0007966939|nr:N-acetylmuramoyl-L-alanine amidase [Sporosarcina sp. HYO08]KXH87168.1 hypothetical protein AU377_00930 [Sporosarcina sp. HYO08]
MTKIICIDPGHGGIDPGGGSNAYWKEKDLTLDISFEQKRHFERNGIKVVMTRTRDEYLGPTTRTNRVKASGADYCICNHINSGGGEGAEVIYSIYDRPTIANGILDALVNQGAKRRKTYTRKAFNGDYYYMHRMTGKVRTVIVEYGFADHTADMKKLLHNWRQYAEAVAKYYIVRVFGQRYISEKKEVRYLDLTDQQKEEMAAIYKLAREKGIFSSAEHEKNVKEGTLPIDDAIFLASALAGAALNGGKRVK